MGLYANCILPHLIHSAMRQEMFVPHRLRVLSFAVGRVLEIGVGSGINLAYYPPATSHIIGLDTSPRLLRFARDRAGSSSRIELIEASAEQIPLDDHSVDTAVTTWSLCSIANAPLALREVRRVLKSEGHLLFAEHGRAPETRVGQWQDRLTPIWKRCAGGCHLNRPIAQLIEDAGFHIEHLENCYLDGPRPLTYMYEGRARS